LYIGMLYISNADIIHPRYRLMRRCWQDCPSERPFFHEIHDVISEMLEKVRHQLGSNSSTEDLGAVYVNICMGNQCLYENIVPSSHSVSMTRESVSMTRESVSMTSESVSIHV